MEERVFVLRNLSGTYYRQSQGTERMHHFTTERLSKATFFESLADAKKYISIAGRTKESTWYPLEVKIALA